MVSRVAPSLSAPLVLFTYYNPILRRGMDHFCKQIKEAGASGGLGSRDGWRVLGVGAGGCCIRTMC